MKKFYNIFLALAAVIAFAACSEDEVLYNAPEKTIEIVSTDVVFAPEGGVGTVNIEATGSVVVTSDKDWCVAALNGNVVTVTVPAWEGVETRYAKLTLKSGDYKVNVTVQQAGVIIDGLTGLSFTGFYSGLVEVLPINTNYTVTAGSDEDWIHLEVAEDNSSITVTLDPNTGNETRFGSFFVTCGSNTQSFDVKQYPEFTVEENWHPGYEGRIRYNGTIYESVYNDVDEEVGSYFISLLSEDEWNELGSEPAQELALQQEEELAYLVALYNAYGYDVTPADFLYSESDYDIFNVLEPGKYYATVFGFDEDGYPTGRYAVEAFEVPTLYVRDDWTASHDGIVKYAGNLVNQITFTAGEEEKYLADVMSVDEFEEDFYSEPLNMYLFVKDNASDISPEDVSVGEYVMHTEELLEGGDYYAIMIGVDDDNLPTGDYSIVPFEVLVDPTPEYEAWLGDWTIATTPRVQSNVEYYDTWTLEQGIVNQSFVVNNFGGLPASYEFTVTLDYDGETNTISCANGQTIGESYVDSQQRTINPTLLAKVLISGSNYRFSGDFTIFEGEMNDDKDVITLTPKSVTYQGAPQTITGVQPYGVHSSGAVYWKTETPLPNTLVKGSGEESVKRSAYQNVNAVFESVESVAVGTGVYVAAPAKVAAHHPLHRDVTPLDLGGKTKLPRIRK